MLPSATLQGMNIPHHIVRLHCYFDFTVFPTFLNGQFQKQRKMGRSLSIYILSRIATAILHPMITLHRFYQKWIQLLDIYLLSKELENWSLVSENTPEFTMQGVSQLFPEMLDILTAKPDSLVYFE